jgi:glycolate oxidase FAD binding subunit
MQTDIARELADTVAHAVSGHRRLRIRGNGTKAFYTGSGEGETLAVAGHRGIVAHEPTELVITARAGTPLVEIENKLATANQMLGFEPPGFSDGATLGGTIACGLSGPRRPYAGSARDFVLGATIINGKGECLRFGGQVMKNVAGFDVSRLMVGSLGTLGVLLEVSLKVLPRPAREQTLTFEMGAEEAIRAMNRWAGEPLPLSAAAHSDGVLSIRLSGSESGVRAAAQKLGGQALEEGAAFWHDLKEQRLPFFANNVTLWRLSLPPAAEMPGLPGDWFLDWGGAQRWLTSHAAAETVQSAAARAGGHAVAFRHGAGAFSAFALPAPGVRALHAGLRRAFDPHGVFHHPLPLDSAA